MAWSLEKQACVCLKVNIWIGRTNLCGESEVAALVPPSLSPLSCPLARPLNPDCSSVRVLLCESDPATPD